MALFFIIINQIIIGVPYRPIYYRFPSNYLTKARRACGVFATSPKGTDGWKKRRMIIMRGI
jgi:hypothetical protein